MLLNRPLNRASFWIINKVKPNKARLLNSQFKLPPSVECHLPRLMVPLVSSHQSANTVPQLPLLFTTPLQPPPQLNKCSNSTEACTVTTHKPLTTNNLSTLDPDNQQLYRSQPTLVWFQLEPPTAMSKTVLPRVTTRLLTTTMPLSLDIRSHLCHDSE